MIVSIGYSGYNVKGDLVSTWISFSQSTIDALHLLWNSIQKKLGVTSSKTKLPWQPFRSNVDNFIDVVEVLILENIEVTGKAALRLLQIKFPKEVGNRRVRAFGTFIWGVTRWNFILSIMWLMPAQWTIRRGIELVIRYLRARVPTKWWNHPRAHHEIERGHHSWSRCRRRCCRRRRCRCHRDSWSCRAGEGSKEHVKDVRFRGCRNGNTILFVCLDNWLECWQRSEGGHTSAIDHARRWFHVRFTWSPVLEILQNFPGPHSWHFVNARSSCSSDCFSLSMVPSS